MGKNLGMNPDRVEGQLQTLRSALSQLDAVTSHIERAINASSNPYAYGISEGQDILAPWSFHNARTAQSQVRHATGAASQMLALLQSETDEQRHVSNTNKSAKNWKHPKVDPEGRWIIHASADSSFGPSVKGEVSHYEGGVLFTAEGEAHAGGKASSSAEMTVGADGINAEAKAEASIGLGASGSVEADAGIATVGAEGEVFLGARAEASADAHIGPGGASAKIGAEAMVGAEAEGKITSEIGVVSSELYGEAFAGARAEAKAEASIGPHGPSVNAGVEAFAGASAEAGAKVEAMGAEAHGSVGVTAGIGVKANTELGYNEETGKYGFQGELKFAIGVGVSVKVDISFSPRELSQDIAKIFGF